MTLDLLVINSCAHPISLTSAIGNAVQEIEAAAVSVSTSVDAEVKTEAAAAVSDDAALEATSPLVPRTAVVPEVELCLGMLIVAVLLRVRRFEEVISGVCDFY